jgi:hypothetical protein
VASQVARGAGSLIAEKWGEGFLQRSMLRTNAWNRLEERIMKEAVEFVPRASLRSPPTGTEKDQSKLRCRSGPAHRHRQFPKVAATIRRALAGQTRDG